MNVSDNTTEVKLTFTLHVTLVQYNDQRWQKYTVELQWLEHFWNHENVFETGVVRANKCYSLRQVGRHNRDMFSIFFNMKVCCVFSLELPYRGDSNEYTLYTIFLKKNIILNCPKSAAMRFFSKGLKNEFETAVANEPSVFEH